jgi:hypothetical protein
MFFYYIEVMNVSFKQAYFRGGGGCNILFILLCLFDIEASCSACTLMRLNCVEI